MRHYVDSCGNRHVDHGLGFAGEGMGAVNLFRGKPQYATATTPIATAEDCIAGGGSMVTNDYWNSGRRQFCTYVECRVPLDPWDEASGGASERIVTLPSYTDCWYPPTY